MTTLADLQRRNLTTMAQSENAAAEVAAAPIPPTNSEQPVLVTDDVNKTTILQSDKPTNKQAGPQANKQTSKPKNRPTSHVTKQQTDIAPRQSAGVTVAQVVEEPASRRADGRTRRARQDTADRTMVTSLRLAVETVEALDDYCWRHRQRKQDVVQAALDLYFAAQEGEE